MSREHAADPTSAGGADPTDRHPRLPPGFRFGTATAAYQVEGATDEDGRGPSVWDTFCARPGSVVDGSTGVVAADHHHRRAEDLGLLSRLGAGGHRFSVPWTRIQPTGSGAPLQAGLDVYDRFVDDLLTAGIEPMVTLLHNDLPQALEDDGGWLNRATVDRFADYASIVGERLGDRVLQWVPINEPNVLAVLGYGVGRHAPGHELMFDAVPAAHHLLLGHGRAAIALRAAGATGIGCATNHAPIWPASEDPADVGAAKLFDALWNGMFLEPTLLGHYPVDLQPLLDWLIHDGDLATIRQPLDFYGVSYYSPMKVAAAAEDAETPFEILELMGHPTSGAGRPMVPAALREWLIMLRARFRAGLPPVVITEIGAAFDDTVDEHGVVDDRARIAFLESHVRAVATAVERGVDVRGFYVWSLLDGFEWTDGFSTRFGLVHVDRRTQQRTPKASFAWYADLVAAQRAAP